MSINKEFKKVSMGGFQKEDLPLKFVHYPNHYGTFILFSETSCSEQYLCECSKSAIVNYYELRSQLNSKISFEEFNSRYDRIYVPPGIQGLNYTTIENLLSNLKFKNSLCHRCNLKPPSVKYCLEMYGGSFVANFGWYINQTYLKFGILDNNYLPNITPQEFVNDILLVNKTNDNLIETSKWFRDREDETWDRHRRNLEPPKLQQSDYDEIAFHQGLLRDATTKANRAKRILSTKIENMVREEFGFKKVGESWISETLLFQIIKNIYPTLLIHRHFRPDWLNKLELDVYLPELKLGIEYQGQQHFHAIDAWGGEEALEKLQERDLIKKELCLIHGVKLIEIDYTEPLTYDYIKSKVDEN
jgi:hypothetical protein